MKVVLKVTVFDRIMEDISKARRENRAVDYVVVSPDEYVELCGDGRAPRSFSYEPLYSFKSASAAFLDATMECRDFRIPNPTREDSARNNLVYRTVSRETIFGVKLYVVPKEYHPV